MHISPLVENPGLLDLSNYYNSHSALLTRAQREFVSEADGLNSVGGGRHEIDHQEACVELALGGSLVIARPARPKAGGEPPGLASTLRGGVAGFSSASRRRLMRLIASIERQERPIFVTMTYPDLFDQDLDKWKRDMDVFGKRLRRKMPQAGFVWRIEFKERLSGEGKGRVAPHFHLLVYGVGYRDLREFVATAWYEVVGSGSEDHLRASTRVEQIYSYGGIMRYVGKYISKEGQYPSGWYGRSWGVIGRGNLPWAVRVTIFLSDDDGIKLVRLGRKMLGLNGKILLSGLTWIMNAERVLDYLEFLQGFT